tara:strand:- start:28225 stop:31761 length:3537 start_codon:yes stop_codon:yes gene_type:complete
MAVKKYNSRLVFGDSYNSLRINVYATGTYKQKHYKKDRFITFIYDINYPVDVYVGCDNNDTPYELFLYFKKEGIKNTICPPLNNLESDVVLKIKPKNHLFILEQLKGSRLTTHELFLPGKQSALKKFSSPIAGKKHPIEMVIPGIANKMSNQLSNLGFDIDLTIKNINTPITRLNFDVDIDSNIVTVGDVPNIKYSNVKGTPNIPDLPTTYLPLKNSDLNTRYFKFNYGSFFKKNNFDFGDFKYLNTQVYAVHNDEKYNVNVCGILENEQKEIPYNISRFINDKNEIKPTYPSYKNGIKMYPLTWVDEIRNNQYFNDCNRCLDIEFYCNKQYEAFKAALKENQIAELEEEFIVSNDVLRYTPKFYTHINQWIERTTLNPFNDVQFFYKDDGEINYIRICPEKEIKINQNEDEKGRCNCWCSDGYNYIQPVGPYSRDCGDEDCNDCCWDYCKKIGYKVGVSDEILAPLSNLRTDLMATTFSPYLETYTGETISYTGYSSTTNGVYIDTGQNKNPDFDLYFDYDNFVGSTQIPIGAFADSAKRLPLIGVPDLRYRPYIDPTIKYQRGGPLKTGQNADLHTTYTTLSAGTFRFTYNASLDVKYLDSTWCQYLATNYYSGGTIDTGFPNNDYDLKGLINTTLIDGGAGSGEVIREATDGKFYTGKDGISGDTGILDFKFEISFISTSSGGTEETLKTYSVANSELINPGFDDYLTLDRNIVEKNYSGFNSCYTSGTTGNTIFRKDFDINLDTGLVALGSGTTVELKYTASWNTKSVFFAGKPRVVVNLGHKLNVSGDSEYAPWLRITQQDHNPVPLSKKLFYNATKKSRAFRFFKEDEKTERKRSTTGTMFLIDKENEPISIPNITHETFNNQLTFIDNSASEHRLLFDEVSSRPTNKWQSQIEQGEVKDYYLPMGKTKMIERNDDSIEFYMPQYDQSLSLNCNYIFPQINHSYILRTEFITPTQNTFYHNLVLTPNSCFDVPCETLPLNEKYKIIQSPKFNPRQLTYTDNVLTIDGEQIVIKTGTPSRTNPRHNDGGFECKYYCICDPSRAPNTHPFYGTSVVYRDVNATNCDECKQKAEKHCKELSTTCLAKVYLDCSEDESNLYTNGTEYLLPNGQNYVGFYHTHDGVAMVGAYHTTKPHDTLIPIGQDRKDRVGRTTIRTNTNNTGSSSNTTSTTSSY